MTMCKMIPVEAGMDFYWECSRCHMLHRATTKFEKSTECPSCGETIAYWEDEDD